MLDAVLVVVSLALFALAQAYVAGCEHLKGTRR